MACLVTADSVAAAESGGVVVCWPIQVLDPSILCGILCATHSSDSAAWHSTYVPGVVFCGFGGLLKNLFCCPLVEGAGCFAVCIAVAGIHVAVVSMLVPAVHHWDHIQIGPMAAWELEAGITALHEYCGS
eukprot:15348413-Ditylum_brightwellii.AAC.1